MNQEKQKSLFEKKETGYHKYAVAVLSFWLDGIREQCFKIDGCIVFVPDVTVYRNGIITSIYEVVYSHSFTGRRLGLIEYWCYRNATELTVFEVSADYVLNQLEKPERIETMECYIIDSSPYGTKHNN